MKNALSALPCFTYVEQISAIVPGLSQSCFKVNADNKVYFAKTTCGNTETQITLSAAKQALSPAVFYHDQHWLITDFINADNLVLATVSHAKKINFAINLMVQCHQLKAKPAELVPSLVINDLINESHFSTQQKNELLLLAESILPPLNHSQNLVCCHGDLNFSNVLVDQKQHSWLVDYECACTAPAEFDLAMFIAVNNIEEGKISIIIDQYQRQSCSIKIDIKLLYFYLTFSYFINSLWYTRAYQSRSDIAFLNLYQQQWKKFMSLTANK